ncbi:poly(A) RNA polymerase gld-2 homolog A [Halyomorpha halys]|uniref:poly(A) RNA polymerase gld-2 homolog A n=1 Tax=Halyomorpha halys TaxID=286706 RepID=UPI0006D51A1D|nr:poly(A) RNA polymerase gld-2 homolog A-like [Halyomorpha halys]
MPVSNMDLYNAMFPSHLIHIPPQPVHNEGRTYATHPTAFEVFRVVSRNNEMRYDHRKNFILHSNSAVNLTHGSNKRMSSQYYAKTFYNTSKQEYWKTKNTGENKRLEHGSSAPCLISAVSNESLDSGISRSPTPSKQQSVNSSISYDQMKPYHVLPSLEKNPQERPKGIHRAPKVYSKINSQLKYTEADNNRPLNMVQNGHSIMFSNNRHPLQRREVQSQAKRRTTYNRNVGPFFKNRRMYNFIFHYPSPYPPSSLYTPYYTAPDRFLQRSHLMPVTQPPEGLLNGSTWDQLSQNIWKKFFLNQQSEELFKKKMALWKFLYVQIKTCFPKYGLYLVGSTMNGFGSQFSDVDMCLIIRYSEVDQRNEAVSYLSSILKLLERCELFEKLELIQAKVPLLKFRDSKQNIQVDLNCNNSVGIRNTHLLYCYGQMDWRVKPLVLVVKLWAQWHNINDAKNMTISSYSLSLMVIHFLQCGVTPRVLPCLHELYADKFNPEIDIGNIDIHEDIEPFNSENKQTLGELLLQFYQYYTTFEYVKYAISIRLASTIPIEECRQVRTQKNDPHQWKYLCIEEPFDLTNTARSVYDPEKFEFIRNVIIRSGNALMKTKKLDSIFYLEAS